MPMIAFILTLAQKSGDDEPPSYGGLNQAADKFRDAFNNTSEAFPATGVILGLAGVGLVLVTLWAWSKRNQQKLESGPLLAFHRVASHFGLDLKQQWLLVRIARGQSLSTPLALILSNATLDHYASRHMATMSPNRKRSAKQQLQQIERMLFGQGKAQG